jgi:hypothetical protein
LNEIIIGSYCKKPDAIIFYRFEIGIFSLPLEKSVFKKGTHPGTIPAKFGLREYDTVGIAK